MKALRYDETAGPLRLVDVPKPECPPDGAVLAVAATGVCRSDWHAWQGHDPVALPHVPGHELAGRVLEVGPQVTGWAPGARVTVPFVCGCGRCETCAAGEAQVCPHQTQPGFTGPGSFAERVAVHAAGTNLVALPDQVDDIAAAALGCRLPTAFRALTVHGRVEPGQWVAVHGCGGLGLSAVTIAVALGARVVALDRSVGGLARARELGAEAVLQVGDGAVGDGAVEHEVRDLTGGGAHVSLDAVGHPEVSTSSVRCLRRRGRHVQAGLLLGDAALTAYPMDVIVAHELTIAGSHGMAAADYPSLLDLVVSGRIDPARLVGRVLPLSEATSVLADLDDPALADGGITVLTP